MYRILFTCIDDLTTLYHIYRYTYLDLYLDIILETFHSVLAWPRVSNIVDRRPTCHKLQPPTCLLV